MAKMLKVRFYQPLYYANILNKNPATERYLREIRRIGLNNFEAKRMLDVFEDWVYLLWNTEDSEVDIRKRFLFGILRRRNFKFSTEKKEDTEHPMVMFFNLLVRFYAGDDSVYEGLVKCVDINPFYECYDFRW